jgi:prepilin-type N-terminal cleavage/methylation domain-containing protein
MKDQQARSRQDGFSLVEILIATMVLTVGLLAMAASTAYVATHLKSTSYTTQRTQAKERMVEELRATTYANVATSNTARTVGRFSMTWNVSTAGLAKRVSLITSGPAYLGRSKGQRTTVVDTMSFSILSP